MHLSGSTDPAPAKPVAVEDLTDTTNTPFSPVAVGPGTSGDHLIGGATADSTGRDNSADPVYAARSDDAGDWEDDSDGEAVPGTEEPTDPNAAVARVRRRRRTVRQDAAELRLLGRRALCKSIADLAPYMGKQVKLRVLGGYLESCRGLEDDGLTQVIKKDAAKLADRARVLAALDAPDPDFGRGQVKAILFAILLQEETHGVEENRLYEKVAEFEKDLVKRAKGLDLTDMRKRDPDRWHHYETYRVVSEAAWTDDGVISPGEARLLGVLRDHLGISREEHWLIQALLKRFPKEKCGLHSADEINEARKELQRAGLLWSYRDENDRTIDVIPAEIAAVIRRDSARLELQRTNYRRLLRHDQINLPDLRVALEGCGHDRAGAKAELIDRVVASDIRPSEVLDALDKERLSAMCGGFGLRTSGAKAELVARLIDFYDDLTFEERVTRDEREGWYNNYELLAGRAYAELRAKKIITKDLDVEHLFEKATAFLFEVRLGVACERANKDNRADGRLPLDNNQVILWDCKSVEAAVNLQDHLDDQFDGYLRREREAGRVPLAFLVIGLAFTPQSLKLAYQYKARTNWDVALVTAEGLRHLAERWAATEPGKPFPVSLLNRTDVIDKERAEFLLSLA